jgi:EpsI family protein
MKRILPSLAIAILASLTVVSGALQGRLTSRWGMPPDAKAAVAALESLPQEFGGWRLQDTQELSEVVRNTLQCEDHLVATYVNDSGAMVNFAILLGPHGPISVHTPEVCYSSRQYDIVEDRARVRAGQPNQEDHFWRTRFRARDLDAREMHVYYAWSDGGPWTASQSPRVEYAGRPYLFKLQLAGYPEGGSESAFDPCEDFLNDFAPAWRQATSSLHSAQ